MIDFFTKYTSVKILKILKTALQRYIEIVNKSRHKQNKLWVNQGRQYYNNPIQKWLDDNYILINSTCSKDKLLVAERLIKTPGG